MALLERFELGGMLRKVPENLAKTSKFRKPVYHLSVLARLGGGGLDRAPQLASW